MVRCTSYVGPRAFGWCGCEISTVSLVTLGVEEVVVALVDTCIKLRKKKLSHCQKRNVCDALLTNILGIMFMHPTKPLMVYVVVNEKFLFLRHSFSGRYTFLLNSSSGSSTPSIILFLCSS